MSGTGHNGHADTAPGEERFEQEDIAQNLKVYLTGLGLETLLTAVSCVIAGTTLVW